jgi:hypothetical protein
MDNRSEQAISSSCLALLVYPANRAHVVTIQVKLRDFWLEGVAQMDAYGKAWRHIECDIPFMQVLREEAHATVS